MKSLIRLAPYLFFTCLLSWNGKDVSVLSKGIAPEISVDAKGIIRIVFGRNDSIFYASSTDKGEHFTQPYLVAHVPGMHLGNTRGPQIASSAHYSIITAMDKKGDIYCYLLDHNSGRWSYNGFINDQRSSAPEGLMGIAADGKDHFYAVWLDMRLNKQNNIWFSSLSVNNSKWSPNSLVYHSPDGHTCECCKPNIAVNGQHLAIMFRNWLNGSRDLYCTESTNSGQSFNKPVKLGKGTWKLNGCPMDGGGVVIDNKQVVHTVWQREGEIYYCKPGEQEIKIDKGRSCGITYSNGNLLCSYQEGKEVKLSSLPQYNPTDVGAGTFLKTAVLPDKKIVCVWQENGQVKERVVNL
jgi:hypothetical protein